MPTALTQLVLRASTIAKPYNCQDAVLIIKSLSALRLNRPEVRSICEKACFSLASSPQEVPAAVVVDIVNHLSTVQSSHLPVVHKVLIKRFCELSCSSDGGVDPRTAQKAALALVKLGRSSTHDAVVEHVLRLLHSLLQHNSRDTALHMAYVALYPYSTRFTKQPRWWLSAEPVKPSVVTLRNSLRFLLERKSVYEAASGNVGWQLLHLFAVLPPSDGSAEATSTIPSQLICDFEDYCATGALTARMSAGAYVDFVQAFGADVCRQDLARACLLLRCAFEKASDVRKIGRALSQEVELETGGPTLRRMNVYDLTKLTGAVAEMLTVLASPSARSPPDIAAIDDGAKDRGSRGGSGVYETADEAVDEEDGSVLLISAETVIERRDTKTELTHLALTILDGGVAWEQREVSSHAAHALDASVGDALLGTPASLDGLLVATLLHGYAKATRVADASLVSAPRIEALLAFIPKVMDSTPSLLSWLLASLAALVTQEASCDRRALLRGAHYALRQYTLFAPRRRTMRTDVEALFGAARLAVSLCDSGGQQKGKGDRPRSRPTTGVQAAQVDDDPACGGEAAAGTVPLRIDAPPFLEALQSLMSSVQVRLRESEGASPPALPPADLDILLLTLIDLYVVGQTSLTRANDDAAAVAKSDAFLHALDHFQHTLLLSVEDSVNSGERVALETAAVRAVRLQLLLCAASGSASVPGDFAERALPLLLRYADRIEAAKDDVTPAVMLRCLTLLQRGNAITAEAAGHAAASRGVVLEVLCKGFKEYVEKCAQLTSPPPQQVAGVVRVLSRAVQAGVLVVLQAGEDEKHSTKFFADQTEGSFEKRQGTATLAFPLALCQPECLTARAAAGLLRIAASAETHRHHSTTLPLYQHPILFRTLASSVVSKLLQTPDVECMVRVLRVDESQKVSERLFASSADVEKLLRCTELHLSHLLQSVERAAEGGEQAKLYRQAGRFLSAVAHSQLFSRLPIATWDLYAKFREDLLTLVRTLENSTQPLDRSSVLKVKLLCGGVI